MTNSHNNRATEKGNSVCVCAGVLCVWVCLSVCRLPACVCDGEQTQGMRMCIQEKWRSVCESYQTGSTSAPRSSLAELTGSYVAGEKCQGGKSCWHLCMTAHCRFNIIQILLFPHGSCPVLYKVPESPMSRSTDILPNIYLVEVRHPLACYSSKSKSISYLLYLHEKWPVLNVSK